MAVHSAEGQSIEHYLDLAPCRRAAGMSWRTTISKNLQELRFQFCQTSEGSKGVRDFIFAHYQEMKKANPRFPFLIRECERLPARAIARFDYGKEIPVPLDGLDKDAVDKRLAEVVSWGSVMPRSAPKRC